MTDPRPAAWLAAHDLIQEAQRLRMVRDSHTGPRTAPEPLPEAYHLCLQEAGVWVGLAGVSDDVARAAGELLARRESGAA